MEVVVPWQALIDLIEPHYPKTSKKGGRPGDFQERCHSWAAVQAA